MSDRAVSDVPPSSGEPKVGLPRCACGHDRRHFMVSPENHYTWFGTLILLLGVSVEPVKVTYTCRRCWQVFDETTDPEVMSGSC